LDPGLYEIGVDELVRDAEIVGLYFRVPPEMSLEN
jgi:hypothetical protein